MFLFCQASGINRRLHLANSQLHYVGTNPNWQISDKIKTKGKSSHDAQPHVFHMQIVKAAVLVNEQYSSVHCLKPHCHSLALPPLPTPRTELGVESIKGERSQAKNAFLETPMREEN